MTVEQLQQVLHRSPFRAFTIRMVDGRSFRVTHPDFEARSPSGRTVLVFQPDDSCSILDLLPMSELEVSPGDERAA